jgi:serine/threonine protein kinase
MSPEQATGRNIASPCDIYSLGVIAYEALTGHPPFDGRTLAEVVCMHLTSEPVELHEKCNAPRELCELVHRMLDKEPSLRPDATQVRQLARGIARSLRNADGELEVASADAEHVRPAAPVRNRLPPLRAPLPTDEAVVVDPEALEHGVTEMLPVVRKPRWTPQLSQAVPSSMAGPNRTRLIGPRSGRDQVSGEILLLEKRRF